MRYSVEMEINLTPVALILSVAFLGGFVLERFRQPALIGYIAAGALAGSGLLGLHGDNVMISWLAELAVVLLMFMLGIELDISRFRPSLRPALLVVGAQTVLSVGVSFVLGYVFGWDWAQSVLFGLVAALSSTAVAMTVLRNRGEQDSSVGILATAILIAQDIAAVPMLLAVGALQGGVSSGDFMQLGAALAVIGVSLLGIFELTTHPQWVERAEHFFTAGAKQPVVAGLALCFGAAALSGAVGLSTAYGAFALGLLVGNVGSVGSSYRAAVESIHDLLMMVFFLSVGLMLDVGFIAKHSIAIGSLLVMIILLKTIGNGFILRLLGYSRECAYTIGAALGQVGEFSFVLVALGFSSGFITRDSYQMALAVIALSLAVSPLWLAVVRRHVPRPFTV